MARSSRRGRSLLRVLFSRRTRFPGRMFGKKQVWECTFCGVIGSHRRGCHYVVESHHRPPKAVRHGVLGTRARVTTKAAHG